jgi:hypothetical protein
VITTSRLRESPQMAAEEPERARESPTPLRERLRRVYRDRGGGGCSEGGLRVNEQRLPKYRPGDEVDMVVHIQHAPMHLKEVTARYFSKGQEGGIISHIDLSGTPSISEDQPSQLHASLQSEVRLSAKVAPDDAPGVYRLNRVTVKTYGGREHHYSADELGEMGFEIDEEPYNRPFVQLEMGFRTD